MKCSNCGAAVAPGSRFCYECGRQVTDPGMPATAAPPEPAEPPEAAEPSPDSPLADSAVAAGAGGAKDDALLETLRGALAADFEVERELGRGGMAVVYRATERALGRGVALKVLPPELGYLPGVAERFEREARLSAQLDHPNIIPVYRVGKAAGISYMAVKYVEGRDLDDVIQVQGALPIPVVLHVLRGATAALASAHAAGIIHRDIKGDNILIDKDGRVYVADFGIARAVEDTGLTASGMVVGTPTFMSPEQCAGQKLGPQCDQYSLGVVAFQMLSGHVPFTAETLPGIMHHHFFTPVPDLRPVRSDIPETLVHIVQRALAKKPEERFATTEEMHEAVVSIPFTDDDRRKAEAMLRELARGSKLRRISTQQLAAAESVVTPKSPLPPASPPSEWAPPPPGAAPRARRGPPPAPAATPQSAATPDPYAATPRASTPVQDARTVPGRQQPWAFVLVLLLVVAAAVGGAALLLRDRSPERAIREGADLYERGRRDEARTIFSGLVRDEPTLAMPHVYLARIEREGGNPDLAARELETAIRLEPGNATALREMGLLLLATGRPVLARNFFVRAARADPDDRASLGYLGCALLRIGRAAEGTRFIQRAGDGPWRACATSRPSGSTGLSAPRTAP
ncbi:MAG: protein kinase domain-containing protein [Gemmatimonadaceae bacterium]